ncbi:MAG: protein kinase [Planctomycetes bacterium]|nr:protein kinase [Planctomycetota bacterium]
MSSSVNDPAESLLARFLASHSANDAQALDAWARAQPELMTDAALLARVQRLRAQVARDNEMLPGGATVEGLFGRGGARRDAAEADDAAPGALFSAGQRIGTFTLRRFLSKGGMGLVWEAYDDELRRPVALKFVRPEHVDARTLAWFEREARAGGRLAHPNIVRTLAFNGSGNPAWIAQELVEGSRTLKDSLDEMRAEENTPEGYYRKAAELVAALADGLEAAHRAGVIHRDVKPQNILIAPDDSPKLTDFGLARVNDDSFVSVTGEFAGTYAYMSPEQVTAKRIGLDHRTDIFSLGVVLYELLSLRRPFEGDTTHQISQRILFFEPPEPSKVRSQCPRELSIICGKALEKDPGRRYASMAEFAADLRRHLADEPIHARPPSTLVRVTKWARRNPGPSSAAAVGAIALAAISGLLVQQLRTASELEQRNAELAAQTERVAKARDEANQSALEAEAERAKTEQANVELRAQSREQKLRGMIQDLARLRAQSRTLEGLDRLGKPAYLWWIEESERLVNGQEEDLAAGVEWRPGLKDVRAKLAELRASDQVLPYSDEDRKRDFETHPSHKRLTDLEAEDRAIEQELRADLYEREQRIRAHSLRLGKLQWPSERDMAQLHPTWLEDRDANALNEHAWRIVGPDRKFPTDSEAVLAMLMAKRAIELADNSAKALARTTYAWSLLRLGRAAEALEQAQEALEEACGDAKFHIHTDVTRLSAEAQLWSGTALTDRESELSKWTAELEEHRARVESDVAAKRSELNLRISELRSQCSARRTWRFKQSQEAWWHEFLASLESELSTQSILLSIAKDAALSEKARARWTEAINAIAVLPKYTGQRWPSGERLTPQLGLLPLGLNPATGLWEFVHLQTGTEPTLDADGRVLRDSEGRLTLTPETGVVFVLLPGGRVPKTTCDDEQDERITEVDLAPHFLSKYELTHEQWDRVSLRVGIHHKRELPLIPANNISWEDIALMLQRELGWCSLPSEAQWEYGCRAEATTRYWPGDSEESLEGIGNLGDDILATGGLRANAFGLHDVHGNVWEWCGDTFDPTSQPREGDWLWDDGVDRSSERSVRGGGLGYAVSNERWLDSSGLTPGSRFAFLGLRLSRGITP